jgi:hypothetical protein
MIRACCVFAVLVFVTLASQVTHSQGATEDKLENRIVALENNVSKLDARIRQLEAIQRPVTAVQPGKVAWRQLQNGMTTDQG